MAEKISYQDLIELVEKETNLNKSQSDDFVKKWFAVINEGLERDGRVRVSKFGIFKLQHVDERSGINPRTKEPITIPEHTKVVFKSAKQLNDHVNRRYNLLQAKPITNIITKEIRQRIESVRKPVKEATDETAERENIIDKLSEFTGAGKDKSATEIKPKTIEEKTVPEEKPIFAETKESKHESVEPASDVKIIPVEKGKVTYEKVKHPKSKDEGEKKEDTHKGMPFEAEKVKVIVHREPEAAKISDKSKVVSIRENEERNKKKWGIIIAALIIIVILLIIWFWPAADEPTDQIAEKPVIHENSKASDLPKPVSKKKTFGTPGGKHSVKRGDKLWNLSKNYYKDAYLWPNIYRVNSNTIPNPDILTIGYILTVPPLEGTYLSLSAKDSVDISVGFYHAYEAYKQNGNKWAKYYLWVCKRFDENTFREIQNQVVEEDASFALSMK